MCVTYVESKNSHQIKLIRKLFETVTCILKSNNGLQWQWMKSKRRSYSARPASDSTSQTEWKSHKYNVNKQYNVLFFFQVIFREWIHDVFTVQPEQTIQIKEKRVQIGAITTKKKLCGKFTVCRFHIRV